tara:strand:- start:514 stop:1170 length:657 start_codon:yes stop_codon:yes gene_type:complete
MLTPPVFEDPGIKITCSRIFNDVARCFKYIDAIKSHAVVNSYEYIANHFLHYPKVVNGKIQSGAILSYMKFYCYLDLMERQINEGCINELKRVLLSVVQILSSYSDKKVNFQDCRYALSIDVWEYEDGSIFKAMEILKENSHSEAYFQKVEDLFLRIIFLQIGECKLDDLAELLFINTIIEIIERPLYLNTHVVSNMRYCIIQLIQAIEIKNFYEEGN